MLLIPKRHGQTDGRLTVTSPRSALASRGKNGKGQYSSSWEPHLRATGCHLPYGITVLSATRCKWTPPRNPSHTGWYSIYLPWRDGRLSWPRWLDSAPAGSRTSDLSIRSPTPNHCTTKTTICCPTKSINTLKEKLKIKSDKGNIRGRTCQGR